MKLIFDSVEECKQFLESISGVSAHECKGAEEPKKQTRTRKTAAKKTTAKKEDAPAEKLEELKEQAIGPGPISMQNTVYEAQKMIADSNANSKVDGLIPMNVLNETLAAFNVPAIPNLAEGDRQLFLEALRKGLYGE